MKGLQSEVNSLTTLVNQTSTALNDRNFQYSMIQIDRDQLRNEHANRSQHHQAELARREREERDRIAVHSAERSKLEEIITRLKREAESRGMEVDALRTMVANAKAQLRDKVKSVKDHYEPQLLVLQNTVDSLSKRTCGCKEQVELAQKSERSLRRELESVRIELAGIKKKYVSGGNISKRGRSPSPDLILPGSSQIPKSSKFKTNLIGGSNRPVIASDGMGNLIKTRPSSSRVAPAPPVLTSFNMNTFSKKNGPSSSSASSSSNNKANNKISSYFRPIL